MNRIIITNNVKVSTRLSGKAEIQFDENKSAIDVFKDTLEAVKNGGKLLIDPLKTPLKSYYRSIPVYMSDSVDAELISKLEAYISEMNDNAAIYSKLPALSGMAQKKDFNAVAAAVK